MKELRYYYFSARRKGTLSDNDKKVRVHATVFGKEHRIALQGVVVSVYITHFSDTILGYIM